MVSAQSLIDFECLKIDSLLVSSSFKTEDLNRIGRIYLKIEELLHSDEQIGDLEDHLAAHLRMFR